MHGHLPPLEAGIEGDVDFFSQMIRGLGPEGVDWIRANLGPGDLYLLVGYQQNEDEMASAATERGARTVFLNAHPAGARRRPPTRVTWPSTRTGPSPTACWTCPATT